MAVGDDPPNFAALIPALQSVLMLKRENALFCNLEISKLSPLGF